MVTHSSILAWEVLWIEGPRGPQFIVSERVRYSWATDHALIHVSLPAAWKLTSPHGRPQTVALLYSTHMPAISTYSVQFSLSVVSNSATPRTAAHQASLTITNTRACSNSCASSRWCHPTVSSSVIPFSSCLQSFPESGSFQMSQLFPSGGQSVGALASASVLPVNIQGWFPSGLTGLTSLQSKGISRVFSRTR